MKKILLPTLLVAAVLGIGTASYMIAESNNSTERTTESSKDLTPTEAIDLASKNSVEKNQHLKGFPIKETEASFIIDTSNITEVVKHSDLTFVGQVTAIENTEYRFPTVGVDKDGHEKTSYLPFTTYKIKIIENIKSDFKLDQTVTIFKDGGLDEQQQYVSLYEGDRMPEVDGNYVFTAYIQKDNGTLLLSGENSNVPLSKNPQQNRSSINLTTNPTVESLTKAYEQNKITPASIKKIMSSINTNKVYE